MSERDPPEGDIDPTLAAGSSAGGGDGGGGRSGKPDIPGVVLGREIARGGMGVVYRGMQEFLSREVAVKVLAPHLQGGDFVARFQREARLLSNIAHPNIVTCFHAGTTDAGQCFMVMELIDGPTLRRYTDANGALPVAAALALCRDLALALEHAHGAGMIHRDVKPDNVLLQTVHGRGVDEEFPYVPKLVDLGLARMVSMDDDITRPGAVMGTVSTMAPEQFDDPESVDYRADIYGLGCVAYQALTGLRAFPEKTMTAVVTRKHEKLGPDPCQANPQLPAGIGELVQSMLARAREERPQSYAAIVERCRQLIAECEAAARKRGRRARKASTVSLPMRPPRPGASPAPVPGTIAPTVVDRPPRRRPRAAALSAFGVTPIAIAVWAATRGGGGGPPADGGGSGERTGTEANPGGNGGDEPTPPTPEPLPEVQVEVEEALEGRVGDVIDLQAKVTNRDPAGLSFAWSTQAKGVTIEDRDKPAARAALIDVAPSMRLLFELAIEDGDRPPVRRTVTVDVLPRGERLIPLEADADLVGWESSPKGSWRVTDTLSDVGVLQALCTGDTTRLTRDMDGELHLSASIELLPVNREQPPETEAAGVMLHTPDAGALVLWLQPTAEGARAFWCNLADLDAWDPEDKDKLQGPELSGDPRMWLDLQSSGDELRVVWGSGNEWRVTRLTFPPGGCCVSLFVRRGVARFYDVYR